MFLTRRIQIIPYTKIKEEFNNVYTRIKDWSYLSWKLSNEIMTNNYMKVYLKNLYKEKNLNSTEVSSKIKELYNCKSEQNINYKYSKKYKEFPSTIRASLCQNINLQFQSDIKELLKGNRSIRNYKRENYPIYFQMPKNKKSFIIEDKIYLFNWIDKIKFELFFGRDKSNNKIIIDRILSGNYICSDSSIKIHKKKIFLNLVVDIPCENKNKLDKNIIAGIDVGYSCLAYCGLNIGLSRMSLGLNNSENSIQYHRKIIQRKRKDMQKRCVLSMGGHGRKKKLKAFDRYKEKEKNFMKTANHRVSREVIKFALKNRAGIIHLENLTGIQDNIQNEFLRKNWTYYQLQQMIEYKAKKEGIEIKYINPKNTSKMCSFCGKINENLKLEDREWTCGCGKLLNRDYNASVNIARSTSYNDKKVRKSDKKLEKVA